MSPDALRRKLGNLADPKTRAFAASLIPNAGPILGVRIPQLRALAKELAKSSDWHTLFDHLQQAETMEEQLIRGMLPGYAPRLSAEERLEAIRLFLPSVTNWCLCDTCCATYRFVRQTKPQTWAFLQPSLHSDAEFQARFGVVMLLSHFVKDPAWAPQAAAILPQIPATGYYAEMAIAWCLCELHLRWPQTAAPLLSDSASSLRPSVLTLARRKIRESRRSPVDGHTAINLHNNKE